MISTTTMVPLLLCLLAAGDGHRFVKTARHSALRHGNTEPFHFPAEKVAVLFDSPGHTETVACLVNDIVRLQVGDTRCVDPFRKKPAEFLALNLLRQFLECRGRSAVPDSLPGRVIATNTTTTDDVAIFRQVGIRYLVTSTPVLDGRSFGTNMMEAAMVAVSGKGRPLTWPELTAMLDKLDFEPQLQELN